ncbi:MAG TPA: hypothetical protein VGF70_16000 [Solirubrobacteraceae bacterium]|jgi:hypothetical protein
MRARVALAGAVALAMLGLTGCGHGPSYCDAVKSHQAALGSLAGGNDRTALIQALPIFDDLHAKAPGDVADDWQLVITRIRALESALTKAGVDPSTYDPKHPPTGTTAEDRALIRRAAAELAAPDAQQALASVQQEVLDVCHTPLDL